MGDRREKQTLIPAFDPEALAKELEAAVDRPTITPSFDPSSYARMVDDHAAQHPPHGQETDARDTPRTMTAATPVLPPMPSAGMSPLDAISSETTATIGRAMYGSYLSSDYPEALVLAERVLDREPDHALARLVIDGCHERLGMSRSGDTTMLSPSSVVRLRRQPFDLVELVQIETQLESDSVLGHIDGVADVTMVAALAGIPRPEALDRIHALLALGLLEVVNG